MKKLLITLVLALAVPLQIFAGEADEKNYDAVRHMNVGGKIVGVSNEGDASRVVIDILGEENVVYVPAKVAKEAQGRLKAGNFLIATGHPHKTDKNKMRADSVTVSTP